MADLVPIYGATNFQEPLRPLPWAEIKCGTFEHAATVMRTSKESSTGGYTSGAASKCGSGAVVGGAVGGAAGAAIGQQAGGKSGAVVGGGAGGAAGAAIGCEMTSDKKPQHAAAKPAPAAVTVAAAPAHVERNGECGRKHNKGKGWAKGHTKC